MVFIQSQRVLTTSPTFSVVSMGNQSCELKFHGTFSPIVTMPPPEACVCSVWIACPSWCMCGNAAKRWIPAKSEGTVRLQV